MQTPRHKGVRLPISILRESYCPGVLVCLPYQGVKALLSLSERLTWGTTWIDEGGNRAELTDDDRAVIDDIIGGLVMASCMDDLIEILTEIRDAIGQGEDMTTIINNVGCGCGCGCGGDGGGTVDPIPPEGNDGIEFDDIVDEYEPPPTTDADQYACNAAHYLYYKFRLAVLELDTLKKTQELTFESFDSIIAGVIGRIGIIGEIAWAVYYGIASWLVQRVSDDGAVIVQEMDRHYDEFICAVYGGDGSEDKRARWYAVLDSLALNWAERYYLKLLSQSIDWQNWFYTDGWQDEEFPAGYTERTCACDDIGGEYLLPPQPSGYMWVPLTYTVDSLTNGALATMDGNEIHYHGSSTNTTRPWAYLDSNKAADVANAGIGAGYIVAGVLHRVLVESLTPATDDLFIDGMYGVNSADRTFENQSESVILALVDDFTGDFTNIVDSMEYDDLVWLTDEPNMDGQNLTHNPQATTDFAQSAYVYVWILVKLP